MTITKLKRLLQAAEEQAKSSDPQEAAKGRKFTTKFKRSLRKARAERDDDGSGTTTETDQ